LDALVQVLSRRDWKLPAFKNSLALEIAQNIEAFLKLEGLFGSAHSKPGPDATRASAPSSGQSNARTQKLKQAGQRIARKGRTLKIRVRRRLGGEAADGIRPENIVWILGAGRTGSSWLSQMMGELEGFEVWFEPWVGALFDPYHLRLEQRKGKHFILSPHYKSTWLRSIRSFVLEGARARFPEVSKEGYLVIKEPGGSVGATLLMEALPESRMILLVRDPRDVAASWLDARKEGGWKSAGKGADDSAERVVRVAQRYLRHVGEAERAYNAHEGRKVLVRYEELRADTLGAMRHIYSTLGIPVDERELLRAVGKHSWENVPEEEKGEGKFYRKATPGSWREDLTPEQVQIVEEITAPLLNKLYPS
jgi:Sulfotransferase domain